MRIFPPLLCEKKKKKTMKKNHVIINKTLPCLIFVPFDVEIIFWKCLWLITSISDTIELSIWQIGAFDGKQNKK